MYIFLVLFLLYVPVRSVTKLISRNLVMTNNVKLAIIDFYILKLQSKPETYYSKAKYLGNDLIT